MSWGKGNAKSKIVEIVVNAELIFSAAIITFLEKREFANDKQQTGEVTLLSRYFST